MRPPILICLAAAGGEFIGDAWRDARKFAIQLINNESKSPMQDLLTLQIVKCRSRFLCNVLQLRKKNRARQSLSNLL